MDGHEIEMNPGLSICMPSMRKQESAKISEQECLEAFVL
jgi:hypothetical protein